MLIGKENLLVNKTKLIATAGPSFSEYEQMRELIAAGVSIVRINISHGNYEEYEKIINNTKKLRKDFLKPISILLDTKGPEIRIHSIKNSKMPAIKGEIVKIYCYKEIIGQNNEFSVTYKDLVKIVSINSEILVDDGKLLLNVQHIDLKTGIIDCLVMNNHSIGTKKAINIPGKKLSLPFISEYDKKFIIWGIENKINYIAASFVRDKNDLFDLKNLLKNHNAAHIKIISKIESLDAIENLDEIIVNSDAIMIARGDLGVETPFYKIPFYQELIISKCKILGKSVIIATEMLDSMISSPRPTKAEITDVFNSSKSGVDATMLSSESSVGRWALEAVKTMMRINNEAEHIFNFWEELFLANNYIFDSKRNLAYNIANKSLRENIKYILDISYDHSFTKLLVRFRTRGFIFNAVNNENSLYNFGIDYGTYSFLRNIKGENFSSIAKRFKDFFILDLNVKVIITDGKTFEII